MLFVNNAWDYLRLLQSNALAKRFYYKIHGQRLSTRIADDIRNSIRQAEYYFSVAEHSHVLVRPAILYYGCVALARALVMLLSRSIGEVQLPERHGLRQKGWNSYLGQPNSDFVELEVSLSSGTFSQLGSSLCGLSFFPSFSAGLILPLLQGVDLFSGNDRKITLMECISRNPFVMKEFVVTFGKEADYYPVGWTLEEFDKYERSIDFFDLECWSDLGWIMLPHSAAGMARDVRAAFFASDGAATDSHLKVPIAKLKERQLPYIFSRSQIENTGACLGYIIRPFQDGFYMTMLQNLYISAYVLGTLARYYPSNWIKIFEGGGDNGMFPLIWSLLGSVEERFPELIWLEIWSRSEARCTAS